jgi:hypothetical protein
MRQLRDASRTIGGTVLVVAGTAAIALLAKGLYPADLPESSSPDFVDNVFDNRGVLWAARLLLVSAAGVLAFGGIFIVLSIGIRMKNGEWLRRAGPFEIAESDLGNVKGEAEFWYEATLDCEEDVARLRERLKRSEELVNDLQSE